jgi:DNA-binding XRE family transcriptional regulator
LAALKEIGYTTWNFVWYGKGYSGGIVQYILSYEIYFIFLKQHSKKGITLLRRIPLNEVRNMGEELRFECRLRVMLAEIKAKDPSFTHEQFAERVGIGKSTLSGLINGHKLPNLENAYRIARELAKITGKNVIVEDIWTVKEE